MPVVNIGPQNVEGTYKRGTTVTVRLMSTNANTPGYAGSGVVIAEPVTKTVQSDTASPLTFTLTSNDDITPSGTFYEYTVNPPGRDKAKRGHFQVPDGAGPYDVEDILVDSPASPNPAYLTGSQLATHEESVGNHDDVDLTGNAAGKVLMFDGTDWVPADTHATDLEVASAVLVETNARTAADSALAADILEAKVFTNVQDSAYGATGDGVTDDTAAIHLARDAGGPLFFPDGDYLVTGLTANVADQTWILSSGATIILDDEAAGAPPVIDVTADGVTVTGPGTIDGNKANQTATDGTGGTGATATGDLAGIRILDADDLLVDKVRIRNTKGRGVFAARSSQVKVLYNRILDTELCGVRIMAALPATVGSHADCAVIGNYIDRSSLGIGVLGKGICVQGSIGAELNQATRRLQRVKVHGNTVRMPESPTDIASICIEVFGFADFTSAQGNETTGGTMGLSISDSEDASIVGNTIYKPKAKGIEMAALAHGVCTGNTVDGGGLVSDSGIQLDHSATTSGQADRGVAIGDNRVRRVTGVPIKVRKSNDVAVSGNAVRCASANPGIYVVESNDVAVTGNLVNGASTAVTGVSLEQVVGATVTGNPISDTTTQAVLLTAGTGCGRISVAGNNFSDTVKGVVTSGTIARLQVGPNSGNVPGCATGYFPALQAKTANQTWNANTTLATITDLTFDAEANGVYLVEWKLLAEAASATPDWKFALTLPAGATARWGNSTASGAANRWITQPVGGAAPDAIGTEATTISVGSAVAESGFIFTAIIIIGATAGTVGLQAAQNTSDASNSVIKTGSMLTYHRAA